MPTRNTRRGGQAVPRPLCQCMDGDAPCTQGAVQGTVFCAKHQNCPRPPLSGWEPAKNNAEYNKDANIYKSHNCYSYAMHVIDQDSIQQCKEKGNCRRFFHQPGALSGQRNAMDSEHRRTCGTVETLMKSDISGVTNSTFYGVCPAGTSKVAAVVDEGVDYHWYRQDNDKSNGYWTHKDGSNKVKDYDALKQKIFNPELAARDYRPSGSDINYDHFCGFYCVPRKTPIQLGKGGRVSAQKGSGTRKSSRIYSQRGMGLSWKDYRTSRKHRRV